MKLLLDEDVYEITARFLKELGHEVQTVAERGLKQAEDIELLYIAQQERRIFITRDRDFGELVFVKKLGAGVIYLRILPPNLNPVHKELEKVLKSHSENVLENSFVVIEPGRHRLRKIPR